MSITSKSIDKNKRYAGIKTNDFVSKTRSNETSRANARTQGWANLGKVNSRRIPPPANLPSLKSETGTNSSTFDPTIPTGTSHGWSSNSGNQTPTNQIRPLTPSKQPTQQQLDSLPAHASGYSPITQTNDLDKPRLPTTWSNITAGNTNEQTSPPNLLGLNDFPRLATQETKQTKSTSESLINSINTNNQGPSFRPANLASWKEGGGRAQPIINDSTDNSQSMQSQNLPPPPSTTTTTSSSSLQTQMPNSSYMRMSPQQQQQQQMWSYNTSNSYGSYQGSSMYRPSTYNSNNQSQQQRLHPTNDYKTPTILRNKDIDDLSKLTDNVTWASASQEVNYEEKIRFSDDEDGDTIETNTMKSSTRRLNNNNNNNNNMNQSRQNYSQNTTRSIQNTRSRLLKDDEHLKQMQDDKSSELVNVLNVARQRRDEQERPNRDQRPITTTTTTTSNEQKQMPGYQTRPLLSSTGQESSTDWTASRTRHDTTDSQTFAMKSWSDQMDSFNYASLHEKSNVQIEPDDDKPSTNTQIRKYSRSESETSSQSQSDLLTRSKQSKHFPLSTNRKTKTYSKSKTSDDYFEKTNSNDKWNNEWNESSSTNNNNNNNRYQQSYHNNDRRRLQQQNSDDYTQKSSTRYQESTNQTTKSRSNLPTRSTDIPSLTTKLEQKPTIQKSQPAWRTLSPTRPIDTPDPTPQEAIQYKIPMKTNEINDRRQSAPVERKSRYTSSTITATTPINTASIPPLMSVRSDVPPSTSKHYKTSNQTQRQDYNSSSHYSQRNDFYNDNNDSAWGNDDEYYDEETGYYDSNISTHQRSLGYNSHSHHRGYTTLGSYGRYRRGGTLRHQQNYNNYNLNNTSNVSSQLNTSTGSKTKKILTNRTTNKKSTTTIESVKPVEEPIKVVTEEPVRKPAPWAIESKPIVEEIPIVKSTEPSTVISEKSNEILPEQKIENDVNLPEQTTNETISPSKKSTTKTINNENKSNYYQNQQTSRHRNVYSRSMQDYDNMQLSSQNYFSTNRRGRGATRSQNHSNSYYYDQRYNNQYNYSADSYHQSHQTRSSTNRTNKRGQSTSTVNDRQSTLNNLQKESTSDNEQKEGEEWETASESSANMRLGHHENTQQTNKPTNIDLKINNQERTPPKKSFANQRPTNSRHNESTLHRRTHAIHDRSTKSTRTIRTNRLPTTQNITIPQNTEDEAASTNKQAKKDQHRHSLDGYDLNNVAGVVKIETLPASALEEESTAFDDGGEEFCVVMSKRGRKEQKAAQLSKQNAIDNAPTEQSSAKTSSNDSDVHQTSDGTKISNENNAARTRNGKSLPPRFNSKSSNRQNNTDQMYYYDQNYYYYDQSQYYDDNSYYNYNNYNQSHRPSSTRRKQRGQQQQQQQQQQSQQPQQSTSSVSTNQQQTSTNPSQPIQDENKNVSEKLSANVMSNIQMWDPHTDHKLSSSSKLIEKPTHDRKFVNEIDSSLPLQLSVSKTNENLVRTIKPPIGDNKTDRDVKTKSTNFNKSDAISSLGSNQLFEKSTFLDYDDKQSIGTVGDDYNQKINSLKTIWDISDHPSGQLEQTINSMVAMQQKQQENNVSTNNSTKSDTFVQETIPTSSSTTNANVVSVANDESTSKSSTNNSNSSSTAINPSTNYSTNTNTNKNEQKNICTVKPTQQVPPNIQDQVDVNVYQTFPVAPLPAAMSQASIQQQQHLLPQSQVNPLHQQHSYTFYENLLPPPPPPQQTAQQQQYNRYPPQNFPYRNTNVYMAGPPPPNVPNQNSMYHHTSQGSISAPPPPQNSTLPMPSYPSPFLVDHGGHMLSQPQPPPPPPQAYMNNQMMSGRPQGGPYYRTPPQQQLQTPPGPPYGTQDPLAHGGYYPPFFQPPNSNAPPVGHPSPHNLYGQNEGFHPPPPQAHPPMFPRGGSIDRGDHSLMSQPLSRPNNYPSNSSNQPQQQGPPPSLLSQNLKSFHTNQQQTSSSNQPPFYPPPPPNQYNRQPMPIGAMNTNNNRQQTQQVPSLMSGLTKNFSTNTTNLNNTPSLFQHRQPLLPPQSTNNRPLYQHHNQYSSYSKSATTPNDDNVKPKHI